MVMLENVHCQDLSQTEKNFSSGEKILHEQPLPDESNIKVESWKPEGISQPSVNTEEQSFSHILGDEIIAAIATVYDPEIPVNVYELGLIYAIDLQEDGHVLIEMTLTAPNCPSAQELPAQVQEAVEHVPGVRSVQVDIVWDPPWDTSRMSDEARLALNMF
ncbi:MAG: SUF system Fe-S cluster assembly protein [Acetobacter sp.]|nr:SUF system Fe-S cluster assembly protein [Acetobacter sp.]